MRVLFTLLAILTGFSSAIYAQDSRFFVPREIRNAYEAGTRSTDGKPGPNYWQNTVDYKINANLDPTTRTISGTVEATYHNNSPDPLNVLVIRLYQDVFKKGGERSMNVNEEDINDTGMQVSELSLDGQPVDVNSQLVNRVGTNMYLRMTTPLASGSSADIKMDWSFVVPTTLRRTGVYDSTSYHVAYWYPQLSVYDDVFGWDGMNYTFQTEFYNNLGNYDVTLSAPEDFNIWATGVLQNPDEIFPEKVLEKYKEAKGSTEVVNVLTAEDLNGYATKGGSWHYVADEVSDFAFSVSNHYQWDAAIQRVEDRDVLISTVYPVGAEGYEETTTNQQKAMKHFSEDMPGIPYPYPAFTTFIGLKGGGMEFPMMANNANGGLGVTVHEMYHTYFPMYVRINERRFAWMDEGWAQYITDLVIDRYFNDKDEPVYSGLVSGNGTMGSVSDLPLITSTQFMDNTNYGYASYSLPAFFYGMLHDYLGDEVFTEAYREYIQRWAKKSPTPYDFLYTMEDVSGKDLAWLYNPWFFNYGNADVGMKELKGNKLTVENLGSRPVPLKVDVYYADGSTKTITKPVDIWNSGKEQTVTIENPKDMAFVMVSQGVPDENSENNIQPSLEDIYAKVPVNDDVTGTYALDQYPITMDIAMQEGKLHMVLNNTGLEGFLLPLGNGKFQTTNGIISVEIQREGDAVTGANIGVQGTTLTSKKQ